MSDIENYPHEFAPPGFIPVNRVGSFTVNAGASATVLKSSPLGDQRILIPNQFKGYLHHAGIVLSNYASAFYHITESGNPKRDYTRLNGPLGAPETPVKILLDLKPSQPIDIFVDNTAGSGPVAVRWRLFGWYYQLSSQPS